ncbi:MAG TPA: YggT family protein [Dehalococcoidia bacterium]|nr:YggT family protein [Dehalococcoidia bacterium]
MLFGASCNGTTLASQAVCLIGNVLILAILIRALLSWFNMDPRSPIIQMLNSVTEPILDPIRRIMPRLGMIDLSPLIAIFLLVFISNGLQQVLG